MGHRAGYANPARSAQTPELPTGRGLASRPTDDHDCTGPSALRELAVSDVQQMSGRFVGAGCGELGQAHGRARGVLRARGCRRGGGCRGERSDARERRPEAGTGVRPAHRDSSRARGLLPAVGAAERGDHRAADEAAFRWGGYAAMGASGCLGHFAAKAAFTTSRVGVAVAASRAQAAGVRWRPS
jgi:hypothetical protein